METHLSGGNATFISYRREGNHFSNVKQKHSLIHILSFRHI